jgi:F0F1-type ATP synthase epsilon subunit
MADTVQAFKVKVFSPYQIHYAGSAVSLSAANKAGPFDVLFDHSHFFSTLLPGIVRVDTGFEILQIQIDRGILQVSDNHVVLFANV